MEEKLIGQLSFHFFASYHPTSLTLKLGPEDKRSRGETEEEVDGGYFVVEGSTASERGDR
jgi:hypothetical protein